MFSVGEFIFYSYKGVCKVTDVGSLNLPGVPKDKMYYTLEPYGVEGDKIFTPIDNPKSLLRPLITKEAAMELIDHMDDMETLNVADERKRELCYRDAVKKCDCRELVKIIKTTYLRKRTRSAAGKRATAEDEKYFRIAEDTLYNELALALGMEANCVKDYIVTRIEAS